MAAFRIGLTKRPELPWQLVLGTGGAFLLLLAAGAIALLPLSWAALVVVGTTVVIVALWRVEWALLVLVFAVPFGALRAIELGAVRVTGADVATLLLLVSWSLRAATQRRLRLPPWPLLASVALLIAVLGLASRNASSLLLSVKELLKWVELAVVVLAVQSLKPKPWLATLAVGLLLAGSLEALIGWAQFLFRLGPEGYLIGPGFLRAYGTFGQPNPFAGYLGLILPLAAALTLNRGIGLPGPYARWTPLVAGLLLSGVLISFSRGAWLGTAGALALVLALHNRRSFMAVSTGALAFLLFLFLGGGALLPAAITSRLAGLQQVLTVFDVRQVIVTPENWSVVERMVNWQTAWEMFKAEPWLGIGPGNFGEKYDDFVPLRGWPNLTGHAHNYYLTVLAEAGLIGLTAYLIFLATAFGLAVQAVIRSRDIPELRPWALGGLGVLAAHTMHNGFDSLYVQGMATMMGLWLGVLALIVRKDTHTT